MSDKDNEYFNKKTSSFIGYQLSFIIFADNSLNNN